MVASQLKRYIGIPGHILAQEEDLNKAGHLPALRQDRYDFPSISKSEHKALSRAKPAAINIARR